MTDPEDSPSVESRLDALEQWQSAVNAVSAARRWLVPVVVTASIAVLTVAVNVAIVLASRK